MARFDKLELASRSPANPESAVELRKSFEETDWIKQADGERRTGQYENALRLYSRALELDKSLVQGWLGQVQMLVYLDECVEAEVWSRKALELFPNNGELLAARAQALCRTADTRQAQVVCDGSFKQAGQSAYRWIVRGELLVAGSQDLDRHCFDKAQQIDADWLVPLEIALIYLHYRLPSRGLDRVRLAVETAPDRHYCWYVQAQCEIELGLTTRAHTSLKRCLELSPGHVEAERRLTEVRHGGMPWFRTLRRLFGRS
jgi:tetratricopeptide (TPR) repeat protein